MTEPYKRIALGLEVRQTDGGYIIRKLTKGASGIGGTWHALFISEAEMESLIKAMEENT